MALLMRRAGAVVPHAVLIDEGWSGEADVSFSRFSPVGKL